MDDQYDKRDSCASSTMTAVAHERTSVAHLESPLAKEIKREDSAFATYGGDDPHEPSPKELEGGPFEEEYSTPTNEGADPRIVGWDGPDDPDNPQNWSVSYKWLLTGVCSLLTVNVYVPLPVLLRKSLILSRRTFASSAPSSGSLAIAAEFHNSREISYLITSVFLFGYVFGPLMWAPGSELFGRRPIFIATMLIYCLFHLGQALAPNIQTLLITRFLSGVFASAPLTNCGGVIADIWDPVGRGPATSVFTASVFVGPVLGPIAGGL